MAKYYLTHKAVEDLAGIWNYTFDEWSESQADKYYQILFDSFEEISQDPDSGRSYEGIYPALLGYKVGKHIIFYRIISESEVEIVRILHERMDLKSRIRE